MLLKISKMEKETPLHPNVLLAQIEELQGDSAKITTKSRFITTNRISKIMKKTNISFHHSKGISGETTRQYPEKLRGQL